MTILEAKYDYIKKFQGRNEKLINECSIFKNKIKLKECNPQVMIFKCHIKHLSKKIYQLKVHWVTRYNIQNEANKILKVYYECEEIHSIINNKILVELF